VIGGFTQKYGVHRLVWFEEFEDMPTAITREKQIKKWKSCMEIAADRKPQSAMARSLGGNRLIPGFPPPT